MQGIKDCIRTSRKSENKTARKKEDVRIRLRAGRRGKRQEVELRNRQYGASRYSKAGMRQGVERVREDERQIDGSE
jgi:hypothetical protein